MSDLHRFFQSDEDFQCYQSAITPPKLIDKQHTGLGKEARTGDIVDAGEHLIKCSNCNAELCLIKIIRPTAKIKSYIIAECPFCNDKSFKREFIGNFCIGSADNTAIVGYPMETETQGEYFIQNIRVKTKKRS